MFFSTMSRVYMQKKGRIVSYAPSLILILYRICSVLSICNSLMAMSITHSLKQTGGFQIASIRPGCKEIARECADASADILLMEAAFNIGATLDDCLKEAKYLRSLRPECKVILLCDENSAPEVARRIALAKKDGLIDNFFYSSVTARYLLAALLAL